MRAAAAAQKDNSLDAAIDLYHQALTMRPENMLKMPLLAWPVVTCSRDRRPPPFLFFMNSSLAGSRRTPKPGVD